MTVCGRLWVGVGVRVEVRAGVRVGVRVGVRAGVRALGPPWAGGEGGGVSTLG